MENNNEQPESPNEQTSSNSESAMSMALTKISDSKNYGASINPKTAQNQAKVKQQLIESEELTKASDKKNYGADKINSKTGLNQDNSNLKEVTAKEVAEYKNEEADKSAAEKKGDAIDLT